MLWRLSVDVCYMINSGGPQSTMSDAGNLVPSCVDVCIFRRVCGTNMILTLNKSVFGIQRYNFELDDPRDPFFIHICHFVN